MRTEETLDDIARDLAPRLFMVMGVVILLVAVAGLVFSPVLERRWEGGTTTVVGTLMFVGAGFLGRGFGGIELQSRVRKLSNIAQQPDRAPPGR